ncbi:MAG: DUF3575 domain-containing protein [Bacteroides sp.]|nr:DUF3575 domain-containing protein [Bacteroides sp.]
MRHVFLIIFVTLTFLKVGASEGGDFGKDLPDRTRPYFALRNNGLLDVALLPNLTFEGGRGQWSAAATWAYAWWSGGRKCWRIYGGELEGRYWFGKAALEKTLTGHHAGVFVGLFTYDIKLGSVGRQCPNVAASWGLSYGYSFPIARRWNIDLNIGVGFIHSHYERYRYMCGQYVCDGKRKQHYFGPVKAEVSFVWLLGEDNYNRNKR